MIPDAMLDAAQALCRAERVLLAAHLNPDGDTMGSVLALGEALACAGKRTSVVCVDEVPLPYRFMPGAENFLRQPPDEPFDTAVALDCDGEHRLGRVVAAGVRKAPCVIEIDHHTGTARYGDIVVVDSTAAATGELVFELLRVMALPINPAIATNLYVAVLTDTGSFRFANTTPRTLRIAAELVECGADPAAIAEQVYETRPLPAIELLGRALSSIKVSSDGAVAWSRLTEADFERAGASDADTEGIVNHLRAIAGVKVGVLFRQVNGRVRVSLRAREPVNVARVARVFGGGGHRVAAGCTLDMPVTQAERHLLAEVRKALAGQE